MGGDIMKLFSKQLLQYTALIGIAVSLISDKTTAMSLNEVTGTRDETIVVIKDGIELELKDARGLRVTPVTIDNTTYLPLRAISENMGWDVGWDNDKRTITLDEAIQPELKEEVNEKSPEPTTLTDFGGSIDKTLMLTKVPTDLKVGTMQFIQGGILKGSSARAAIDLSKNPYASLSTYMAVKKTITSTNKAAYANTPVEVRITEVINGKEVSYFTKNIYPNDAPVHVELDLRNKSKIKIALKSDVLDTQLILGDAIFNP
ncbi:hypothetical protein CA598_19955 [Paenibacillus sp. VTT E-133291]|nr:hypothetical protein CA598_19955 [Paenibacillus sp. VTT E-133291]